MISTRVEKVEVLTKLIPVLDELTKWIVEHEKDVNAHCSEARFIRLRLLKRADFATRIYRLCEFRGDTFITIDIDSIEQYTLLTVKNIREDVERYGKLRAKITPPPVKPAVTSDDYTEAGCAIWCSLIIVTVSLIAIFP